MSRKNGYIIYEGPSMLDGKPIVVIATGFANKTENAKTGNMIQTWILRSDINPYVATHTGDDVSICGDCPHRGEIINGKNEGRSCYVKVFQAPNIVWKAYKRGDVYPKMDPVDLGWLFADKAVRFGSYGDPASVPFHIIDSIGSVAEFTTGYTHQWRTIDNEYAKWVMASADSLSDRFMARAFGYRTFRVRGTSDPLGKNEVVCPASEEAGRKTNCAECKACGGTSAKAKADIVIMAHGHISIINNFTNRKSSFEKAA